MSTSLRLRAAVVAGFAGLAVVGTAGPAAAAAPRITFLSPGAGQELGSSDVTVSARVEMSNGVLTDSITYSVVQLEASRPAVNGSAAATGSSQTIDFPVSLPYNGRYRATVKGTGRDQPIDLNGNESTTSTMEFLVAAPPDRPTDVKTAVNGDSRAVAITWRANTEPDLLFYVVQRAKGSSNDFTVLGQVNQTTYVDSSTASSGGDYKYQVVAVRNGVRAGEGISSDPSALTAASTAKVPDPPPPPTTAPPTTAAPAGGSGGTTATTAAGGSAGTATSTPASSVPANSPGALTSSGTVDLSGFNTVIKNQPRSGGAPRVTVPEFDPGFQATLPFDPNTVITGPAEAENPGDIGEVADSELSELGDDSDGRFRTMAFFAAGLLATVLLMHVLWVKSEIRRVPLEAIDPEGPMPVVKQAAPAPRFAAKKPQEGPALDDIGSPDFEPAVVAPAGKKPGAGRRPKVPTGA